MPADICNEQAWGAQTLRSRTVMTHFSTRRNGEFWQHMRGTEALGCRDTHLHARIQLRVRESPCGQGTTGGSVLAQRLLNKDQLHHAARVQVRSFG